MLDEFQSLRAVSSRMGRNLLLIQGGGGNASLKQGGKLHVKSSGTWMSDALDRDIFVTLDLQCVRDLIARGSESFASAAVEDMAPDRRPSIETALHAIMPHPIVLHVHSVNAICTSLLPDSEARLDQALSNLDWAMVPYVQPGAELASAVGGVLKEGAPDVILLCNHGLVVGAATAIAAEALTEAVEALLALPSAELSDVVPPSEPSPLSGYRWSDIAETHALAHRPDLAASLTCGALLPDQVVYLGGPSVWIDNAEAFTSVQHVWRAQRGVLPGFVLLGGAGALIRDDITSGGSSMVRLLTELARRIPAGTVPSTLTLAQEQALLGWEAEAYRLGVDTSRESKNST